MEIEVKKLTVDLLGDWLDFFDYDAFSDEDNWPGCYCMHFHWDEGLDSLNGWNKTLEQVYKKTGKADNRGRAIELIKNGTMQGYLAYHTGKVVGWCNANDKNKYKTVLNSFFDNAENTQKIKSIVCFCTSPELRRKGITSKLLEKICADATEERYDYLEAYPYIYAQENGFQGSLTVYEKMGFQRTGQIIDDCIIMRKNTN